MSGSRNLVIRRGPSNLQSPLVLSVKACAPVSLRIRSPDVAVRSSVHVVPAHATLGSGTDSRLSPPPSQDFETIRISKKSIKLGPSKSTAQNSISWEHDQTPTDSQLLRLADQKKISFVLGFSALHWACELLKESVVQSIIDRKLVHLDTFAVHAQFISFTPVFSAISVLWLRAEQGSENAANKAQTIQEEQLCLSIMKALAAAGAKLDSEIEVRLNEVKQVTLLHIAADYACLQHGRAFQQRQDFLLQVARLLADNLKPSEAASLLRRRCKVNGQEALSVKELLESKPLPPKLKSGCISSLLSIFSRCIGDQSDHLAAPISLKDAGSAPPIKARRGRLAKVDPFTGSKVISERKLLPRSRLRASSDASSSFGLFSRSELVGSERAKQMHAVSSCSESDSESGFASGCEDAPATKRSSPLHATRSILASQPISDKSLIPCVDNSQDCETFLSSCHRIHAQCKLGCIPGVGVLSATSSSKCASDVSCPLCGKSVYASVVDPFAVTVHDMQNAMSLHILRECTAVLCNIGGCSWKGGYSHLPLHIATVHTFT